MQVVPTTYIDSHNRTIQSNQYSVTEHFKPTMDMEHAGQLPGVFIFYDLSPIKVSSSFLQAGSKWVWRSLYHQEAFSIILCV